MMLMLPSLSELEMMKITKTFHLMMMMIKVKREKKIKGK